MNILLATDGSALIEEKDARRPGSFGAIATFEEGKIVTYGSTIQTTNNRMELSAVIYGLRATIRGGVKFVTLYNELEITILTDSQNVYNSYNPHPTSKTDPGEWMKYWAAHDGHKKNGDEVENWDLWIEMNKVLAKAKDLGVKISWEWVKGHQKGKENDASVKANHSVDVLCSGLTKSLISEMNADSLCRGTAPTFYVCNSEGKVIYGPKSV